MKIKVRKQWPQGFSPVTKVKESEKVFSRAREKKKVLGRIKEE